MEEGKSRNKKRFRFSAWERLKQQQLAACRPRYTVKTTAPAFLAIGVIMVPIGVLIFTISRGLQEVTLDYTYCLNENNQRCTDVIRTNNMGPGTCKCNYSFEIPEMMTTRVEMYYGLTNFYQNHRDYVDSRDDKQLLGLVGTAGQPAEPANQCSPLDKDVNGKIYFPCGAIANSMFNDTFKLFYHDLEGSVTEVGLINRGIAWENDKEFKFRNPELFENRTHEIWDQFVNPRDWSRTLWDLDPSDPANNGLQNEDFMVWMRVSALPNLRKLHRFINSTNLGLQNGLLKGNYTLEIDYNYEVTSFEGSKSLILRETSFFGGRNVFLGIMLMSVGGSILLIGFIFLCGSFTQKHKSSWNRRSTVLRDYGTQGTTTVLRPKIA